MSNTSNLIKILIVEDDVFIAENLMLTLQELGYDAAEPCVNPKEALAALEKQSYDLALLDIQFFGKEEGIELAKVIAARYNIPFIFLTAYSDSETVAKATSTRPSGYLVKPASPAGLFAAIQTALHNFNSQIIATEIESLVQQESFFVKLNNKLIRIYWADIVSIESTKNYALLKSKDKKQAPIPIRGSLQQILQLLPAKLSKQFAQANRACCVNINYITQVNKETISTDIGVFTLIEGYRKQLNDKLNIMY